MSSCEPESYGFILFDKMLSKLFTGLHESKLLFLICVYLICFCKLDIRKIFMSSPGSFTHLSLVWVSAHQVHSRVSNVNFVLCVRGDISCRTRSDPMSIHCVEYNIFVIGR
jgi:hypothetical protein